MNTYEVFIYRSGSLDPRDRMVYRVSADTKLDAAFQAGVTHVAEDHHAARMRVIEVIFIHGN